MWTPITSEDLQRQIANGENALDPALRPLWRAIRIEPAKWQLHPSGDRGGGFWVVAIFGRHVLWFNDIECGFNLSRYGTVGTIAEYRCNQDDLQHSMAQIKQILTMGAFPRQ